MNKAVFALVLVGLVVLATAAEAGYASKDKMQMRKGKAMAKKERTSVDKMKAMKMKESIKRMEAAAEGEARRQGKDQIRQALADLKQQLINREITPEQFKVSAADIKRQAKSVMNPERQEQARKDKTRSKRSIKEEKLNMKMRRSTVKKDKRSSKKLRRGEQ